MSGFHSSLHAAPGDPLEEVVRCYPVRVTRHLEELIADHPALARQFLPAAEELQLVPGLLEDPLAEERHTPLAGLVHRHPDRVLLLASDRCAAICRFCFRKGRRFASYAQLTAEERSALFSYLEKHTEVREVILTGGDPLTLPDPELIELLERLHAIPHLQLLRLHTRLPVVAPERVDDRLLKALNTDIPLYVMLHVNHSAELTPGLADACRRLSAEGVPLGSQTVLLKGVNDDEQVLEELFRGLLRLRVRPYYLHHPDLTQGTGHFRVAVERGAQLIEQLARRLSGLALPRYVVDLPGGLGKLNVASQTLLASGDRAILKTPDGQRVELPNREG